MIRSLSVFFPAFNEEKNIQSTIEDAVAVLKTLPLEWEILVINDGSKDTTFKRSVTITRISNNEARVDVIVSWQTQETSKNYTLSEIIRDWQ
jgi:glycosyltransferase involved in cell wall biosynthesis